MKKIFNTYVIALILSSCTSCDNLDQSTNDIKQTNKLDLSGLEVDFLNTEFTISGVDNTQLFVEIQNKLEKEFLSDELFKNDGEKGYIRWEITQMRSSSIKIKQTVSAYEENILNGKDRSNSKASSCPAGLKEYAKCSGFKTKSCTTDKVAELANNLEVGETISVTRTGFASALVCGSPSLVDRTLDTQQ